MMKNILSANKIFLIFIVILSFGGCPNSTDIKETPLKKALRVDFQPVTVESGDTLAKLAKKHLGDESLAWRIAEFNGISEASAGRKVIIPRHSFRPNGLKATGYQTVPVLTYHHFSKSRHNKLYVREDDFRAQMQYLKDNGYQVINIDQLFDFFDSGKQIPEKSAVITIDDGWGEAYSIAFPILKEFGYPATLFVQTDIIYSRSKKTLSWGQIREMTENGIVDIQCHTKSHRNLTEMKPGQSFKTYFKAVNRELEEAKKAIWEELGKEVKYLAYPYGKTNRLVMDLVEKGGYRGAFTVTRKENPFFVNNYKINRSMIFGTFSIEEFARNLKTFADTAVADAVEPVDEQTSFQAGSSELARQYEAQGQWRTALLYWKLLRDSIRVQAQSDLLSGVKDYGRKIEDAEKQITTLEKKISHIAKRHFNEGKTYLDAGQWKEARNSLLRAALFNPGHQETRELLKTRLGSDKYKLGSDRHKLYRVQAGDTLKSVAAREYGNRKMDFLIAHINDDIDLSRGLTAGTILKLPPVKRPPPSRQNNPCGIALTGTREAAAEDYFKKGDEYFNSEEFCKAIEALKTAVCLDPKHARARDLLADLRAMGICPE
ncbi:MAG: polysaccharide deacetylase family protein [Gammaproteobacteria bacterium]|nr:polysaccharide deacetylase family protein [Gammaproteobacteria bacterium]